MHMADALISPLVGGAMYLATVKAGSTAVRNIRLQQDDSKIPMMGVMGAFVFAVQMINFTIPGTGSSGHLGGGMLLAAILGPYGGFLTMAAIMTIQALFFADGGLLALGSNIFNLGFFTCFIAYPYIYKRVLKKGYSTARIFRASMLASVVGLQLGAFGVVVETILSGKIELSFTTFLILMQSIHLAIGIVEGLVTAAVINFLWKARPELMEDVCNADNAKKSISLSRILIFLMIAALLIGGVFSLYASGNPDGLEWSLSNTVGQQQLSLGSGIHNAFANVQNKLAILPRYHFKGDAAVSSQAGKSLSGIIGAAITLLLAAGVGIALKALSKRKKQNNME